LGGTGYSNTDVEALHVKNDFLEINVSVDKICYVAINFCDLDHVTQALTEPHMVAPGYSPYIKIGGNSCDLATPKRGAESVAARAWRALLLRLPKV
jgi:hypothetical protein